MRHWLGKVGLLVVALIWGSGFVVSAISLDYYQPFQVLFGRFAVAFLFMALIFCKSFKKIKKSTLINGSIMGIILYLGFALQTVGLDYTTPSKNAFFTALNVVLVPFIDAVFFKSKIPKKVYAGSFLAIIGIGLMGLTGVSSLNVGDALTLFCALFFALQIIFTGHFVRHEDSFALNLVQMGAASVCSFIGNLIFGKPLSFQHTEGVAAILYLGLASTLLAYLLQTLAQQYTSRTETAIILSMESVFGMLLSILILKEQVTLKMVLGASLIMLGIFIIEIKFPNVFSRKKQQE